MKHRNISTDTLHAYREAIAAANRWEQRDVLSGALKSLLLGCFVFSAYRTVEAFPAYMAESGMLCAVALVLLMLPAIATLLWMHRRRERLLAAACLAPVYALLLYPGLELDDLVVSVSGSASTAVDFLYTACFTLALLVLLGGAGLAVVAIVRERARGPASDAAWFEGRAWTSPSKVDRAVRLGPAGWLAYLLLFVASLTIDGNALAYGYPLVVADMTSAMSVSTPSLLGNAFICYCIPATLSACLRWRGPQRAADVPPG